MKINELIGRFKNKDYYYKNGSVRGLKASVGNGGYGMFGYSHDGPRVYIDPEEDRIYSFGSHFVLAVRLNPKKQPKVTHQIVNPKYKSARASSKYWDEPDYYIGKTERIRFIVNGDSYSSTTSNHTNKCIRNLMPNIQIPFSALQQAGINRYEDIIIIETSGDRWVEKNLEILKSSMSSELLKEIKESVGWNNTGGEESYDVYPYTDISNLSDKDEYSVIKMEHLLSSTLFRYGRRYFLSSTESRDKVKSKFFWSDSYFLVELPKPVKTISQAYESLIPDEVKNLPYVRQGEWFFTPSSFSTNQLKKLFTFEKQPKHLVEFRSIRDVTKGEELKIIREWIINNELEYIVEVSHKNTVDVIQFDDEESVRKFNKLYAEYGKFGMLKSPGEYPSLTFGESNTAIQINNVIDRLYGIDSNNIGNPHTARESMVTNNDKGFVVRKTIKHPTHKSLQLGKQWHTIHRSKAKGSWGAKGNID